MNKAKLSVFLFLIPITMLIILGCKDINTICASQLDEPFPSESNEGGAVLCERIFLNQGYPALSFGFMQFASAEEARNNYDINKNDLEKIAIEKNGIFEDVAKIGDVAFVLSYPSSFIDDSNAENGETKLFFLKDSKMLILSMPNPISITEKREDPTICTIEQLKILAAKVDDNLLKN